MRPYFLLLFTILTFAACEPKKRKEVELPKIQLDFIRFDRLLAEAKSIKEIDSLLKKNPEITVGYFHCAVDKIPFLAKDLFALFQNPELKSSASICRDQRAFFFFELLARADLCMKQERNESVEG